MGITQIESNALHAQVSSAHELRRIADALEELVKIVKIGGLFPSPDKHNIGTKGKDDE